jgi:hypothetical protein
LWSTSGDRVPWLMEGGKGSKPRAVHIQASCASTPMKLYLIVLGSSIDTWRPERSSGNALAEGWSDPFLQKAGLSTPRTAAANHTRPFWSNMPLWLLARWLQIFSSPQ